VSGLGTLPSPPRLGLASARPNVGGLAQCQAQSWLGLVSAKPNVLSSPSMAGSGRCHTQRLGLGALPSPFVARSNQRQT